MKTQNLGRLFWHPVKLTGAPLLHRGKTTMTEWPYYHARPWIIRTWYGGIVIGWWRKHRQLDVSTHLAEGLVLGKLRVPVGNHFLIVSEDQFYGASPEREP